MSSAGPEPSPARNHHPVAGRTTNLPNGYVAPKDAVDGSGDAGSDDALRAFWEVVKRLPAYLRLATALVRDPGVPKRAKGILLVAGAYTVSPVDLVPGVIPVAGQVDDVYVLLTGLRRAVRSTPREVAEAHLERSGVTRGDIDADLATIRRLVRQGLAWSLRASGRAMMSMGKSATRLVRETR